MIYARGEQAPELVGDGHFVAPDAVLIGHVRLMAESSVWFNCVLRGDNELIDVGAGSNVQDGCVLHTDIGFPLTIGAGVTVGHKVMLHGCEIGNDSLIGIGSTVLNGAKIGRNSLVGAHALITENKVFPDGSLILGAPASVVRELTDEELALIRRSADVYVDNAQRFSRSLNRL